MSRAKGRRFDFQPSKFILSWWDNSMATNSMVPSEIPSEAVNIGLPIFSSGLVTNSL